MTTFGQDLVASAREALAIVNGEAEPAQAFTPPDVDVAAIRKRCGLKSDPCILTDAFLFLPS